MDTPIVRISRGRFSADRLNDVQAVLDASAFPLVPAIRSLSGLLYYHAAVDANTLTVVNVSIWRDLKSA